MLSCCIFLGHVGKASLGAVWPPGLRHTLRKSCRIYMMESPCNQLVGKSTQSLWGHECLLCVCREFPHWLSCSSVGAYLCILHCWRPFYASDSHCRSALMLCRVSDPVRRILMFVTKTQLPKEESQQPTSVVNQFSMIMLQKTKCWHFWIMWKINTSFTCPYSTWEKWRHTVRIDNLFRSCYWWISCRMFYALRDDSVSTPLYYTSTKKNTFSFSFSFL